MSNRLLMTLALCGSIFAPSAGRAEEVLFEDKFEKGLSDKWDLSGLKKEDYRIRDGALELRVQPGPQSATTPLMTVALPFTTDDTVTASVEITPLNPFTERGEFAGLYLTSDKRPEFGGEKKNIEGYTVFAPGEVDFIGQPGEEGDPQNFTVKYWPAKLEAGPVRVIVRGSYAYFQVGPSTEGKYATYFHSAIQKQNKGLGFGLMAAGGPADGEHWVRFDNLKIVKH